ncbi:MAG: diacylglycerol kinase family lipid kinase, partial [Muribaculaceae bacterium]|nr:diacylglycerol kinase family lipid kinase [Muribaculaceae bacterium]
MTHDTDNRRRAMLIINPISGTGSKEGIDALARKRLAEAGIEVETRYTGARGDATRIASEATTRGFGAVLACGGDGTINETARALCGTDTILGILPAGSGNGLARHVGVPVDIDKALDIITGGNVMQADYGTANGNPFFCAFGLGFDAAVSHRFARQSRRGVLSYIKSTLTEYLRLRPETYT